MKRLFLTIAVAILALEASGIVEMMRPEPCAAVESASEHEECSSTCVRCACCRQPIAQSAPAATPSAMIPPTRYLVFAPNAADDPQVRDIAHVPKPLRT